LQRYQKPLLRKACTNCWKRNQTYF